MKHEGAVVRHIQPKSETVEEERAATLKKLVEQWTSTNESEQESKGERTYGDVFSAQNRRNEEGRGKEEEEEEEEEEQGELRGPSTASVTQRREVDPPRPPLPPHWQEYGSARLIWKVEGEPTVFVCTRTTATAKHRFLGPAEDGRVKIGTYDGSSWVSPWLCFTHCPMVKEVDLICSSSISGGEKER